MSHGEKKYVLLYQRARTTSAVSSIVFLLIIHLFLFVSQYVLNYIRTNTIFSPKPTTLLYIYMLLFYCSCVSSCGGITIYIYTLQNRIVSICRFWIE